MTETIQVELDEQEADRLRRLASSRQMTPERLIRELIIQAAAAPSVKDQFLGLLSDEPELADAIIEGAMTAREQQPFRASDG